MQLAFAVHEMIALYERWVVIQGWASYICLYMQIVCV